MSDPVIEVFRLGVGLLRWPRPVWSLAWMCASRPLDGHDPTFETLCQLPNRRLVRFMLPGVFLVSLTFRAALRHIRDSSRRFSIMKSITKLSARLLNKCLTLSNMYIPTVIYVNIPV